MLSIFLIVFFNWNLTHVCVMICNNILCFGIWFMKTWALHSNTTWTFCIYYFFIPLSLNQMDTSTKWTPGLISVCFRWFFFFFSDGSRDLIYMMEMHSVKIAQFLFPLSSASPHCCQAVGFCHEMWKRIVEGVSNCTNEILTMIITNHSWYRDTPLEQLCQWHEPKIKSEQSLTIFTVQPLASPLQL